jgi:valyl-tRNA synthetase
MVGNADEASLEKTLTEAPIISLRPQAHEIIRTWAFYTIYKSLIHANQLPWKDILISGWGLAGKGMGKISKSRGGGPLPPLEMIERYSADAIRFWAASTNPGKDAVISEQKIKLGAKLINKLWNISRFCQQFLVDYHPKYSPHLLTAADRWILSRCQWLIRQVTQLLEKYEYASAKSEIESFFWLDLADNYLEMSKQRLYDKTQPTRDGARFTLYHVLLNLIKLFAPYIPHVTEEIYQKVFCPDIEIQDHSTPIPIQSIHILEWPTPQEYFEDKQSDIVGRQLVLIATAVRRYKSNHNLSLGTEIDKLQIIPNEYQDFQTLKANLQDAYDDIRSITRSNQVEIVKSNDAHLLQIEHNEEFDLFIHVGQDI